MGSGCGSVDRAVAFNSRGLWLLPKPEVRGSIQVIGEFYRTIIVSPLVPLGQDWWHKRLSLSFRIS